VAEHGSKRPAKRRKKAGGETHMAPPEEVAKVVASIAPPDANPADRARLTQLLSSIPRMNKAPWD
jgi:hypothetical protein